MCVFSCVSVTSCLHPRCAPRLQGRARLGRVRRRASAEAGAPSSPRVLECSVERDSRFEAANHRADLKILNGKGRGLESRWAVPISMLTEKRRVENGHCFIYFYPEIKTMYKKHCIGNTYNFLIIQINM